MTRVEGLGGSVEGSVEGVLRRIFAEWSGVVREGP